MPARGWNRNIHYHDLVLGSIPPGCQTALDAGCGEGLLTQRLADRCAQVVGIDKDRDVLARARSAAIQTARVAFIEGDVMTHPFDAESFDLITAVATLHHMPLGPALVRFRSLLRPGGYLAVIGLYRLSSIEDYARAPGAVLASWAYRCVRGTATVRAPIVDPRETLQEIRAATEEILPGASLTRQLLFRYSLFWRKPSDCRKF